MSIGATSARLDMISSTGALAPDPATRGIFSLLKRVGAQVSGGVPVKYAMVMSGCVEVVDGLGRLQLGIAGQSEEAQARSGIRHEIDHLLRAPV